MLERKGQNAILRSNSLMLCLMLLQERICKEAEAPRLISLNISLRDKLVSGQLVILNVRVE